MIDQEDPKLNINIQDYGCYFMSIIWWASHYKDTSIPQTADEFNAFYKTMVLNDYMQSDCLVLHPDNVFGALGLKVKQYIPNGSVAVPPSINIAGGIEILCYKWDKKNYTHFVCGENGKLVYDPIQRGSNTVKNGVLHSKRVFERL